MRHNFGCHFKRPLEPSPHYTKVSATFVSPTNHGHRHKLVGLFLSTSRHPRTCPGFSSDQLTFSWWGIVYLSTSRFKQMARSLLCNESSINVNFSQNQIVRQTCLFTFHRVSMTSTNFFYFANNFFPFQTVNNCLFTFALIVFVLILLLDFCYFSIKLR